MSAKQWTIISCGIDINISQKIIVKSIKISQKLFGKSINISQFFIIPTKPHTFRCGDQGNKNKNA